jgi:hypothetical protein
VGSSGRQGVNLASPQEDSGVGYLLRAKALDTADNFEVKVDWNLSVTSGQRARWAPEPVARGDGRK